MHTTIFVIGAGGNIGAALLEELAAAGARVKAGAHSDESAARLAAGGARVARIDLGDRESLVQGFRGAERLFLMTPLHERMAEYAGNAVAAAKEAGVAHIVRSSLLGAADGADFKLGAVHGGIDAAVRASGIPWTLLRPNCFMQNFSGPYRRMITGSDALFLPQGEGKTSFIDARDAAACAAAALLAPERHAGRTYDLTGPEALSGGEAAAIIGAARGAPVTHMDIPPLVARGAALSRGMPAWNVEMLLSLFAHIKAGKAAAVTKAVAEVAGRPARTLREYARENARAWEPEL
ncbi:MAG TPA: NmrA family NAD(P)-binding protein [Planctomycetota bacterium]|jgi:uncharacterized protein YbjT (DUF2867 family)|nr:NmrA family NAD(P)-binding protein [Planctomycetota bacterium]OQC19930.1 MAG: NAD(P)H azoreductase [Planctomycetes bacterium ADurb.Bin069]HNR99838.1 NmrA family NAD(P)-binding protein [Planctomycetota bacterium]HNU26311.1 NmrA family NAD(P)-binding protein [Planctomycetota bacterium]HOE28866.1 NmrA family NAD(P)-binding protein [Planctomycetota bacterium]